MREWMQSGEGSALQREMDYLLRDKQADETFRASSDAVRDIIKSQLSAAGRFTQQANDSYAALTSSFYAVQAAKMGMTPEELYRQYPLQVMSDTPSFAPQDMTANGIYNQLVDVSQYVDRGSQRIKSLAEWAKEQLEKEGFHTTLTHSGSAAGPSSYIDVEDTHTGAKLNKQLRFSGHSKGAYQHQFIHNLGSEDEVLALIEDLKAHRTPERVAAYQEFRHRMAEQKAQQEEARAQQFARQLEAETQRLQRAEEKEANGEPLSNMDSRVLKARDEGRLLRDGGNKYWQIAETTFRAPEVRNEQGELLAPNGAVSNLDERQWHQVRSPQFKAWFGDWEHDPENASKVVDENGEPLVVYHGTAQEDLSIFDLMQARQNADIPSFFFSTQKEEAEGYGDNVIAAFLNIRNPVEKPDANMRGAEVRKELEAQGVDGTVVEDDYSTEYAAFNANQIKSATDNSGAFDGSNPNILYQRSQQTKAAYEARIDELFAGGKANRQGARVLDRSDIMGLLGYPDVPLVLAETHLIDGMSNHPEMTAKQWKKVPQWLDNPAAVYTDPKHPGRLTVIGPELLIGAPVVMAVEPSPGVAPQGHKGPHQLLVTVFAKTTGDLPSLRSLEANKRLEYVDTKKAPVVWRHIGDNPQAYRPTRGAKRILTEKNLAGYRKEQGDVLFARQQQQPNVTRGFFDPSSNTIGLLKDADLSTYLHEAGHFFLEMQVDLASRVQQEASLFGTDTNTEGQAQIAKDMQILLDWFGVRDLAELFD